MTRSLPALSVAFGLLGAVGAAHAQTPDEAPPVSADLAENSQGTHAHVTLVADHTQVPADGTLRVGVRFELDPGWHMYWHNPGESGLATHVAFEGVEAGELRWPAPHEFESPGPIITYGYADEVLLFAEAQAAGEDAIELRADVDFLLCEVSCIPARTSLGLTIPRGEATPSELAANFDAAAAAVPEGDATLRVVGLEDDAAILEVECDECDEPPTFIPAFGVEVATLRKAETEPQRTDAGWRLPFTLEGALPDTLTGVLWVGERALVVEAAAAVAPSATPDVALPGAEPQPVTGPGDADALAEEASSPAPTRTSWILAILFGILGGLILNLMPCVLPVLAVKVFGWLKASETGEPPKQHATFYAIGVIGSMLALGGVVLGLRAAGHEVGLGFQLQEPKFVAGLTLLLAVMATSFFGLFELRLPANKLSAGVDHREGAARSIGEGVLTVVLATPCSAPMLSVAVGFAFTGSAAEVLSVMAAIGFGLALPFLLLARFPRLGKFLPKPGAWMEKLQRILGFALLATAAWLAWVFGNLTSIDAMAMLVGLLVVATFGVWLLHAFGRKAALVALPLVVAASLPVFRAQAVERSPGGGGAGTHVETWPAWSEEAVQAELAAGRHAVIVFTADWCLTCKLNERVAFGDADVQARLAEDDVAVFVGDWTRRDDTIRAELARHGRASVPLVMVRKPGEDPTILPELLSPSDVLDALPTG